MTKLTNIEQIANEFNNDAVAVTSKIRALQSAKSRLKKQKGLADYDDKMTELIQQIQVLTEVKQLLVPKEKFVTEYEQSDVELLNYDETVKAIKTIQSKKTLTRWLTNVDGDNDEFRNACRIEQMLKEHRDKIQPVSDNLIRKSDLVTIIETIESNQDLSQERIVELLKSLL